MEYNEKCENCIRLNSLCGVPYKKDKTGTPLCHIPNPGVNISKIILWWENELTGEDRTRLMGSYKWHGTVQERHQKLREMYVSMNTSVKEMKE